MTRTLPSAALALLLTGLVPAAAHAQAAPAAPAAAAPATVASAYFAENRDITRRETLLALWGECGLPDEGFERCDDPAIREAVLADHREAIDLGIHGVPAVRIDPNPIATVGAHPLEAYRRWFLKELGSV